MASLSWSSGVSITAVAVLVMTVVVRAPEAAHDQNIEPDSEAFSFIRPRFFAGLSPSLSFKQHFSCMFRIGEHELRLFVSSFLLYCV